MRNGRRAHRNWELETIRILASVTLGPGGVSRLTILTMAAAAAAAAAPQILGCRSNIQYSRVRSTTNLTWTRARYRRTWRGRQGSTGTATDGASGLPPMPWLVACWRGKGRQSCVHDALTYRIWRRSLTPVPRPRPLLPRLQPAGWRNH